MNRSGSMKLKKLVDKENKYICFKCRQYHTETQYYLKNQSLALLQYMHMKILMYVKYTLVLMT